MAILKQAEKDEQIIQAIRREHAITETTFYRWRKMVQSPEAVMRGNL